jgi:hypothetical protein
VKVVIEVDDGYAEDFVVGTDLTIEVIQHPIRGVGYGFCYAEVVENVEEGSDE